MLQAETDVDSLVKSGFTHLRQPGELQAAGSDFESVLRLAPTYVDAAVGLATVWLRRGKPGEAGKVLDQCGRSCAGDTAKLRYLSSECWRLGFVELGRRLDRETPPVKDRRLTARPHRIAVEAEGSRLENGSTWQSVSLLYAMILRPDVTVQAHGGYSERSGLNDGEGGMGLFLRATRRLSLSYEGSLSGATDLFPSPRHRLRGAWDFGRGLIAGAAGDFSGYKSGWVRLGRLDLEQSLRAFTLRYALGAGYDNFDKTLVSHVGSLSWEATERISATAGGGYGNETVERYTASFLSQQVATLFLSGRFRVNSAIGAGVGLAAEWRDRDFFRMLVSLSLLFSL